MRVEITQRPDRHAAASGRFDARAAVGQLLRHTGRMMGRIQVTADKEGAGAGYQGAFTVVDFTGADVQTFPCHNRARLGLSSDVFFSVVQDGRTQCDMVAVNLAATDIGQCATGIDAGQPMAVHHAAVVHIVFGRQVEVAAGFDDALRFVAQMACADDHLVTGLQTAAVAQFALCGQGQLMSGFYRSLRIKIVLQGNRQLVAGFQGAAVAQ